MQSTYSLTVIGQYASVKQFKRRYQYRYYNFNFKIYLLQILIKCYIRTIY